MKIAYILNSIINKGGIERIIIDKANALAERPGIEVFILCSNGKKGDKAAFHVNPNVRIINLESSFQPALSIKKRPISFLLKWLHWRQNLKKAIRDSVEEYDIDITISSTYDISLPYHKSGCHHILESHCSKNQTISIPQSPIKGFFKTTLVTRQADILVALTENDRKLWREAKRTICLGNFTTIKQSSPYDPDNKKAVAVGRLDEQKGFDILIKAWESVARSHPDWKLDIYGTGRDKEMLQNMIDKSGLTDKVTLCGVSNDMPQVYASGSIFVLSSRFEGFGLVLLEAMTCGVPCVSFDCPEGPSEIIADGRDGILVPFRGLSDSQRAEALAENICRMIENRDMRLRMSQEAIAKAATFSRDTIIDRWIELFNDLTKK